MRFTSLRGREIVYLLYDYKLVVNTGKAKCTINGNVYIYTQGDTLRNYPQTARKSANTGHLPLVLPVATSHLRCRLNISLTLEMTSWMA